MFELEEPIWYPIYASDRKKDFEKSNLLLDLDEDLDEDEIKRRKQKKYLENVKIKELSFVSAGAVRKKYYIKKGDEKEMVNEDTLISNFDKSEPEKEVKKYNDKIEWVTPQRQIFGYCRDDLDMIDDRDIYEIEKSNEGSKWPSLTRQFSLNKQRLEKAYEEYELETRLV